MQEAFSASPAVLLIAGKVFRLNMFPAAGSSKRPTSVIAPVPVPAGNVWSTVQTPVPPVV